jgi:CBS domain containing-hemolysin-like protein
MSTSWALVLAVLLLAGNAFFVAAEFAIISARRSSIEPLADEGDRRARTVLWAMEHVSLMLAVAQLGVTVCSTSLGLVAEPAIAHLLLRPLEAVGANPGLAHPIAFVVALVLVVYLHVVLGEMVPKNLAVSGPDQAVLLFGPPLVWVGRLVRPVVTSLDWTANHALRLFGVEPKAEIASAFTAQEVQSIVERSRAEGLLPTRRACCRARSSSRTGPRPTSWCPTRACGPCRSARALTRSSGSWPGPGTAGSRSPGRRVSSWGTCTSRTCCTPTT